MARQRSELETEIDWYADNLSLSHTLYEGFLANLLEYFSAGTGAMLLLEETSRLPVLLSSSGPRAERLEEAARLPHRRFVDCLASCEGWWTGKLDELIEDQPGHAMVSTVSFPAQGGATRDVRGAFVLLRPSEGEAFGQGDAELLEAFGRQSAESLAHIELLSRQGRMIRQQRLLAELGALLNAEQENLQVREKAVDAVRTLLQCDASSLILKDTKSTALFFDVATGRAGEAIKSITLDPGEGIAGFVIRTGENYLSNDLAKDEHHSKRIDEETSFESRNLICVPLSVRDQVLGALQALNSQGSGFTEHDVTLLELLAHHVATAIESTKLYGELRQNLVTLKNQQDALIQAEKLSAMGLLAAGVAHEIRSPLTAISGYAQLLKRHLSMDDPLGKKIGIIERSVNSINRIVNGLLDFAKKEEACWERVSVNKVIEDALVIAEHTLSRFKKIKVIREFADELPLVEADPRQLEQVFLNLIMNAAEAMRGGGRLTIATSLDTRVGVPVEEAMHRIEVGFVDTGMGITESNRERIFEPFFTEGKKSGTGLGLSICKSIMKKHRGEITFESTAGEGTTFLVYLPVLAADNEAAAPDPREAPL